MELTRSYERVFPGHLLERYEFAEVRNGAAALKGTNPTELEDILAVLDGFWLTLDSLTDPGKNKSDIAADLDKGFRERGWHESSHVSKTHFTLRFAPYPSTSKAPEPVEFDYETQGHKVDNFKGRVALDVEWNAKDGNLDRDLANFRALHDAAVVDAGLIITRHQERTRWAANLLAELGERIRTTRDGKRIILLGTTTTTNLEKLVPRLQRGDGGGCPLLAIAITEKCYRAGPGDPQLPKFPGLEAAARALPDPSRDESVVAAGPEDEGMDK
jgi:restriction endonuclease BglII